MGTAAAIERTLARTTNKLEVLDDKSVIGGPIVAALGIDQPHALDAILRGVVADTVKLADLPDHDAERAATTGRVGATCRAQAVQIWWACFSREA